MQGARCGEGLRFRNVSCFVSDSSGSNGGSLVDEELCGDLQQTVEGDTLITLEEACTLPCPGSSLSLSLALSMQIVKNTHEHIRVKLEMVQFS